MRRWPKIREKGKGELKHETKGEAPDVPPIFDCGRSHLENHLDGVPLSRSEEWKYEVRSSSKSMGTWSGSF